MFKTGQKTVTTAGARVALGTDVVNSSLVIKADPANTGKIYIGDVTVTSSNGFILTAGDQIIINEVGKLADIYIDGSANTQKVCWIAMSQL